MFIIILIIGLIAGIISGLAMGGATFLVPALVVFLNYDQHIAQGIGLAFFLPTGIVAAITHYRQGNVKIKLGLYLVIGGVFGAVIGSLLALNTPTDLLKRIFGIFLISMGLCEYFGKCK